MVHCTSMSSTAGDLSDARCWRSVAASLKSSNLTAVIPRNSTRFNVSATCKAQNERKHTCESTTAVQLLYTIALEAKHNKQRVLVAPQHHVLQLSYALHCRLYCELVNGICSCVNCNLLAAMLCGCVCLYVYTLLTLMSCGTEYNQPPSAPHKSTTSLP